MIDALRSTLSAIRAHERKMTVHANNIANANTNGYKGDRALLQEGREGEVRTELTKDMSPAPEDPLAPDAPGMEKELSNVDLADELTATIPTEIGYKANLKTIRSRDDMIGTLLDTLA